MQARSVLRRALNLTLLAAAATAATLALPSDLVAQTTRVTDGLVAYYPFSEGTGSRVFDRSLSVPYTDLTFEGDVVWLGTANGASFNDGRIGTLVGASDLVDALQATNQASFEVWVRPANTTQDGPARMLALGTGPSGSEHDYALGQIDRDVEVRLRHTGKTGFDPRIRTSDGFLTTTLVHLVHVFDGATERLYVDGVEHPATVTSPGDLSSWSDLDLLSIGNTSTRDRRWRGVVRSVAIYDQALSAAEVAQNFQFGPDVPLGADIPLTVDAGPDQVTSSAPGRPLLSTSLNGLVDDPDGTGSYPSQWSQISGPQPVVFGDATSPQTTVDLPATGVYVFELRAADALRELADLVTVTAPSQSSGSPPQNLFPPDQGFGVSPTPTLEVDCPPLAPDSGQFLIAEDPTFLSIVYDSGLSPTEVCSHVVLASLNDLTEYHWSARQQDSAGLWSEWSVPTRFTTGRAGDFVTLSYQDGLAGYSGTRDADIRGDFQNPQNAIFEWNQGAQDVLRTGRRPPGNQDEIFRSLLRFELSGVDPDSIANAYLELTGWTHGAPSEFFHGATTFFEVRIPWGEGTGLAGEAPAPGEASWTYAEFPLPWSVPGASDPGIDRGSAPLIRARLTNQIGAKAVVSSQAFVDLVRQWAGQPQTNFGVLFQAEDEAAQPVLKLSGRENADPSFRPRLVIQLATLQSCVTSAECEDGNACTADSCDAGVCTHAPLGAGASCADGDVCNGDETCDGAGTCQLGSALVCDDANACTVDSCDPLSGCAVAPEPLGSSCEDGEICNGAEVCDGAGACLAGDPLATGASCADGDVCNGNETCDSSGTCIVGTALSCDDGDACTVDSCDALGGCMTVPLTCDDGNGCTVDSCSPLDGCMNPPAAPGSSCDDGLFCNGSDTCDGAGACQSVGDPCTGGTTCNEAADVCSAEPVAQLESGRVTVGSAPVTVNLTQTYFSPVVVSTIQYATNLTPVVTRISNVTPTSFDIRLQNPQDGPVVPEDVYWLVVEEGAWTIDGVKVEAQLYASTLTDGATAGWQGEAQSYLQAYTNPVVLGQVMSENDAWSAFWSRGVDVSSPASATALFTGKMVGEDSVTARAAEAVGFVVFEAGPGTIGGVEFEAGVGPMTVQGVEDSPPYTYAFAAPFSLVPEIALATQATMAGFNGGWAQIHGGTTATTTNLFLSLDEDQIADSERVHTQEQVSYAVFFEPVVYPGSPCSISADCEDGNACTADVCAAGVCTHAPLAAGDSCADGDVCNGDETCNGAGTCLTGTALVCDDANACTADSCDPLNGCMVAPEPPGASCEDGEICNGSEICDGAGACLAGVTQAPGSSCDDGLFCNGSDTCDGAGACQSVGDPCTGGTTCNEAADVCSAEPVAQLESGRVTVGSAPVTVNLTQTYFSPVVVSTIQYATNLTPVVTRISNVTPTSFDIRLQNPQDGPVVPEDVYWLVVEEGAWTIDGVKVEAQLYASTLTDGATAGWQGEAQSYLQAYTNPVVLGQVMSENDAWSAFWSRGVDVSSPASATALFTGKMVGEDSVTARAAETVGFVVFEAGPGTIGGVEFEAGVGPMTVQGVEDSPPYTYAFAAPFSLVPEIALATQATMAGFNGGWAQIHGGTTATTTNLFLSLDEDQIADSERVHTQEQVSYAVFFEPVVYPGSPCSISADCEDGNACTADVCAAGVCTHAPLAAGDSCADGDVCNGDETCNGAGTCLTGTALVCDDANACTADSCDPLNGCMVAPEPPGASCEDGEICNGSEICDGAGACLAGVTQAPGSSCDDGLFCNGSDTCDGAGACQSVGDPCTGGTTCNEAADVCSAEPVAQLESGRVTVGSAPVTVNLTQTYFSPVVVSTIQYATNLTPVVTRISNVTPTSFDIRLQNPQDGPVVPEDVYWLVVEEGAWTIDGVKVEAQLYASTLTDGATAGWQGEAQSYLQAYTNPVVLGQVMSENDAWSAFWSRGVDVSSPASATALFTGKMVGEDSVTARAAETVGFVVFEAGPGTIGGVEFEAGVGPMTVQGVEDSPPYTYAFAAPFSLVPEIALATQATMEGFNGSWAQVHGGTAATTTNLFLSLDEDQIADSERVHTQEQVSYAVFSTPVVYPPIE